MGGVSADRQQTTYIAFKRKLFAILNRVERAELLAKKRRNRLNTKRIANKEQNKKAQIVV
ncbi:MAG: hypothetical protein EBR82_47675 [Caulobacteraceae bacterium]|nr:hypothetical protein [Caulobacteraceae bacterium]